VRPRRPQGKVSGLSRDRRARRSRLEKWFPAGAEPEIPGVEEDLTMGDRASTPGSSGDELRGESDELDDAREAALIPHLT